MANICGICNLILCEPVVTECGHVFCKVCAYTSMTTYSECKECKYVLTREPFTILKLSEIIEMMIQYGDDANEYDERKNADCEEWGSLPDNYCIITNELKDMIRISSDNFLSSQFSSVNLFKYETVVENIQKYIDGKHYSTFVKLTNEDETYIRVDSSIKKLFDVAYGADYHRVKECQLISTFKFDSCVAEHIKVSSNKPTVAERYYYVWSDNDYNYNIFPTIPSVECDNLVRIEDILRDTMCLTGNCRHSRHGYDYRREETYNVINKMFWTYVNVQKIKFDSKLQTLVVDNKLAELFEIEAGTSIDKDTVIDKFSKLVNQRK